MNEINPERAIRYIMEKAPMFAQAKANRVFLENYISTVKSKLMLEEEGTLGHKDAYAKSHPDYIAQLEALKIATEQEEHLKYMLLAAQAKIDVWKTMEFTKRQEMKNL